MLKDFFLTRTALWDFASAGKLQAMPTDRIFTAQPSCMYIFLGPQKLHENHDKENTEWRLELFNKLSHWHRQPNVNIRLHIFTSHISHTFFMQCSMFVFTMHHRILNRQESYLSVWQADQLWISMSRTVDTMMLYASRNSLTSNCVSLQ